MSGKGQGLEKKVGNQYYVLNNVLNLQKANWKILFYYCYMVGYT